MKEVSASIASSVVVSFVVVKKDVSWSGSVTALVVASSSFVVVAVAVAVVVAVVSVFDAVEWSVLAVVETESLIQNKIDLKLQKVTQCFF